ncbi:outer membrane beta-barrel protein [Edaphobacter modestus]|uniref:Outer membrane protein with beta-barrel domain n=1 Tax=Edaphobacter modestus TaxID=388466 RepID=A0A4Q7YSC0_9BACT|nr:outer membrane beta-barrel protein [Edaphobacter modestus]RZU40617.1 outer membrane protein with beta-barrel domain [Edaphobacter modestus]
MSIVSRPQRVWSLFFCLFAIFAASTAGAQATSGNPTLDKHLSRLDIAVSGIGSFTKDVSGTNYQGVTLDQQAGSTLGALVTVRYTKSAYVGGEFNYTYARYTQNFSNTTNAQVPNQYFAGGVQNNASEYSLGYVIHPNREFLGAKPFIAVGAGSTAFRPTPLGGQSLNSQARMTYYYSVGVEKELTPHFGLRAQFRQAFFKAPDFGQNFLTIQQQTWTIEPGFGFVIHF